MNMENYSPSHPTDDVDLDSIDDKLKINQEIPQPCVSKSDDGIKAEKSASPNLNTRTRKENRSVSRGRRSRSRDKRSRSRDRRSRSRNGRSKSRNNRSRSRGARSRSNVKDYRNRDKRSRSREREARDRFRRSRSRNRRSVSKEKRSRSKEKSFKKSESRERSSTDKRPASAVRRDDNIFSKFSDFVSSTSPSQKWNYESDEESNNKKFDKAQSDGNKVETNWSCNTNDDVTSSEATWEKSKNTDWTGSEKGVSDNSWNNSSENNWSRNTRNNSGNNIEWRNNRRNNMDGNNWQRGRNNNADRGGFSNNWNRNRNDGDRDDDKGFPRRQNFNDNRRFQRGSNFRGNVRQMGFGNDGGNNSNWGSSNMSHTSPDNSNDFNRASQAIDTSVASPKVVDDKFAANSDEETGTWGKEQKISLSPDIRLNENHSQSTTILIPSDIQTSSKVQQNTGDSDDDFGAWGNESKGGSLMIDEKSHAPADTVTVENNVGKFGNESDDEFGAWGSEQKSSNLDNSSQQQQRNDLWSNNQNEVQVDDQMSNRFVQSDGSNFDFRGRGRGGRRTPFNPRGGPRQQTFSNPRGNFQNRTYNNNSWNNNKFQNNQESDNRPRYPYPNSDSDYGNVPFSSTGFQNNQENNSSGFHSQPKSPAIDRFANDSDEEYGSWGKEQKQTNTEITDDNNSGSMSLSQNQQGFPNRNDNNYRLNQRRGSRGGGTYNRTFTRPNNGFNNNNESNFGNVSKANDNQIRNPIQFNFDPTQMPPWIPPPQQSNCMSSNFNQVSNSQIPFPIDVSVRPPSIPMMPQMPFSQQPLQSHLSSQDQVMQQQHQQMSYIPPPPPTTKQIDPVISQASAFFNTNQPQQSSAPSETTNLLETLMTKAGLSSDTIKIKQTLENPSFNNLLKSATTSVISRLVENSQKANRIDDNMSMSPPSPPSTSPPPPTATTAVARRNILSSTETSGFIPPPLPNYSDILKPSMKLLPSNNNSIHHQQQRTATMEINEEKRLRSDFDSKNDWQERIATEVKHFLKPAYMSRKITKTDYKEIMKRAVTKIARSGVSEINTEKIEKFVMSYIDKYSKSRKSGKHGGGGTENDML